MRLTSSPSRSHILNCQIDFCRVGDPRSTQNFRFESPSNWKTDLFHFAETSNLVIPWETTERLIAAVCWGRNSRPTSSAKFTIVIESLLAVVRILFVILTGHDRRS